MSDPDGVLPAADPGRVRLGRFLDRTGAEGPGARTAIWVQGCSVRCPGCFNPQLWGSIEGRDTTPTELIDRVLAVGTQGVTLLGGEPFDQAAPLAVLAEGLQASGRSVMTFTGYTLERLRRAEAAGRSDVAALLAATDLLVDGPYLADHPDRSRPWVGSRNQRFRFLTARYRHLDGTLRAAPDLIEVRVGADGAVAVNGWASTADLERLLDGL